MTIIPPTPASDQPVATNVCASLARVTPGLRHERGGSESRDQSGATHDRHAERRRAERAHPTVLENEEDLIAVEATPKRVARVGETVFVEGSRGQQGGSQRAERGRERSQRLEHTIEPACPGAQHDPHQREERGSPPPFVVGIREAPYGDAREKDERGARGADRVHRGLRTTPAVANVAI